MDTYLRPNDSIKGALLIEKNSLQKPKFVDFFSSERLSKTENDIRRDASNCKYLKRQLLVDRDFPIDLKEYDDLRKDHEQKHSEYSRHVNPMPLFLQYLRKHFLKDNFVKCTANKLFDADIICTARVLMKMMMVHGNRNESFSLSCTKYKGNIYITARQRANVSKQSTKFIARQALFADKPHSDVNTIVPYITSFHCVFDWKLCDTKLMYFMNQHVDSDVEIDSERDLGQIKFASAEVIFRNENKRILAMHRTPSWWCRSFLLGNAEIHQLQLDEDECIKSIRTIGGDTILRENEKCWHKSSNERISFLNLMLDLIKLRMTFAKNCPLTVYEFHFNPKTQSTVHYEIHSGRNKFTFLTDQYVDAVNDL